MSEINMDTINVMVKDVANFLNNLDGLDYDVIAYFFNKGGFYIGHIERSFKDGHLTIDSELRALWRKKAKFYKKVVLKSSEIFVFIVLKGEEK